ncbi:RNA polymerase sigma factor [Alkalihalobacillus pseudalcaliphilus]|uniref:RNA polymerase sigma factor n=1 Tax=Alkalihalobacillus pseudalcaliphilus TaxID=79884 RepID=UPI00069E1F7D|nr:RNA polymerase sigma factor [Alkalihalobacillus pseudalcaliphilus]
MDASNTEEQLLSIYREHYLDVYRFIISFTHTQDEAEDLTQEVFVRAVRSYKQFKKKSQIKTWLFSIAKNVAIDHVRKASRKRQLQHVLLYFSQQKSTRIEEEIEKKEEFESIQKELMKLKKTYRMVVILRVIHQFSVRETAEIMNWSETKVKVTYHRAIQKLKEQLLLKTELEVWSK